MQAVIFDMDGLMLDTEPLYRIVWKRAAAECGYILTDDAYRGLVGRGRTTAEQVLSQMAGPDFPLDRFRDLSRDAEVHAFTVEPVSKKPGLDELLSLVESRNLPKAVATSTERAIALPLLARMGLLDRFAAVATGDEVTRGKPHPDLFLLAAQRLETSPSLCLVLEDSEAGATAAVSAGMRVYLVPDLVEPSPDVKRSVQGVFGSLTDVARNLEIASTTTRFAGIDLPSFRTNRLAAFPLDERDREELLRMHQNEDVMATLGGVRSEEESSQWLAENLDHWNRHGFGIWIFREATDGRFVGRGGLRRVEVEGRSEIELAYALLHDYWGMGLATEMSEAILKMGVERFQMDGAVALIAAANHRSRRVVEKLGFHFERNVEWKGSPIMMYRYQ